MASMHPGNEIAPSGGQYYTGATGIAVSNVRRKIVATSQGGHLMTTMFVRHTVSDYKTWRKAYDDFAPVQKAGV